MSNDTVSGSINFVFGLKIINDPGVRIFNETRVSIRPHKKV